MLMLSKPQLDEADEGSLQQTNNHATFLAYDAIQNHYFAVFTNYTPWLPF